MLTVELTLNDVTATSSLSESSSSFKAIPEHRTLLTTEIPPIIKLKKLSLKTNVMTNPIIIERTIYVWKKKRL